jgi:TrmH family RNA methyltransferase
MGAIFRVPTAPFDDAPRPWIALAAREGRPIAEVEGATYVLGAEREGLPADVVERCDAVANIPLVGDAESLNVAMAGTVALYEARRK